MRKLTMPLLALFALALPASAAWTYVADAGAWNGNGDKKYSGYVTDGATWTIFVLDLGDGNWQLGAGTWGVDGGNGGSCQAGTTKTSTGIGSGALDVRDIAADTGKTFTKIGPRCFNKHTGITAITIPDTVTEIGNAAFVQCSVLTTITLENGCPNLVTLGSGIFEGSKQISELDLGNTKITTLYRNFDASSGFHRLVFPETLVTMKNWVTAYITDNDMVFHFKGAMPTTIEANAVRPVNISASRKWAFKVDVNTKGTWPIRTDVPFADATLPSVSGETFAEEDYLGYLYLSDLGDNGNGEGMKIWVFKEGVPAAVVPASMAVTATSGRTNATLTATVDLGTSASATVTATLNGETQTATATQNGAVSFEFYGLTLNTAYAWTATVQGADDAAVSGTSHGTVSTLPPEVTLGATSFTQPKDGLSATVSVVVATLTSASADIEFTFDGAVMETRTVTAAGTYDFAVSGLTVGTTYSYSFTATSSENADVAVASGTLDADVYHWVYTPGGGWANGCPYTGTISPTYADAKFEADLTFTATTNAMHYLRVWVADGKGLDFPAYTLHAICMNGESSMGFLKVVSRGAEGTWSIGAEKFAYPAGATIALPPAMVTVKARAASRKTGKGEKSMHQNRKGFKKPVLMWAEEGTQPRKRGGKRVKADNAHNTAKAQGRIGGAWQYIRKGGIKTGRMKPYRFLERATPEMFQAVEAGLTPEVGRAVENVARKCGFI